MSLLLAMVVYGASVAALMVLTARAVDETPRWRA